MSKTAVAGLDAPLVQMAMGYFRSRALCAAARLGVADALGDDERSIEALAASCEADAPALYRLLRALASFGVVAESAEGRFVLQPLGRPLRKDQPDSVWAAVVFWADLLADNWSDLTECVRSGQTSAALRPPGASSRWAEDPQAPAIFRAVMGTAPAAAYMSIARAWDFSSARVVADLGGGGGALIAAILEAHPHLRGMLVDRPSSIEQARPRFAEGALAERCELLAHDLREGVPAGADVYALKHVLHGFSDDGATAVLRHCRDALPPEGRVLIIEFVLPDVIDREDAELEQRLMSDLNMLAVTGGKERSAGQWTALLRAAGLELSRVVPVDGDLVSIVEATRAAA
ncbi:MAG: hypothetical protein KC503_45480 [Myxococcales bacterium]|nr:hypothetical protein [Myxococcales bacterium]